MLFLVSIHVVLADFQKSALLVSTMSCAGIVIAPNFGAPFLLKLALPVTCILLTAVLVFRRDFLRLKKSQPTKYLLFFLTYAALVTFAYGALESVYALLLQVFTLLPLVVLLPSLSREKLRSVTLVIVALGCVQATLAILEVMGHIQPLWGLLGGPIPQWGLENSLLPNADTRGIGTVAHPLPLGMFCAFCCALILAAGYLRRMTVVSIIVLLFAGIFASGTRSALLVAALILAFHFCRSGNRFFIVRASVIFLATSAFALLFDVVAIVGLAEVQGSLSLTHRLESLNSIPAVMSGSLLRITFGTDPALISSLSAFDYLRSSGIEAIDNQWITLVLKFGMVGMGLIALTLFSLFRGGTWAHRACAVAFVVAGWSFDELSWNIVLMILVVVAQEQFGGARKVVENRLDPYSNRYYTASAEAHR
ncbi:MULTISPECIES: hypothetical protein [unclassified Rhodococcus (in: high G+C Gram-positive bacteria)]|uniref:hypothetical protein n=1 Tax=unclassified Rhodococcus (in: high G+C Gram-positive bacteria) TaxID=192944 RepID=UPI0012F6A62B|nr:hypothetical protein [Rhodococcus sp. DK17]